MRFYVCEIKTGEIIDEYPFELTKELDRKIGTYGTGEIALPVLHPECPENWAETLLPWRVIVVICDDSDRIIGGGIPDEINTDVEPLPTYPLVGIEKYLDRRYMPTRDFKKADQTGEIAVAMAEHVGDMDLGIGLTIDSADSGVRRDRDYHDDEDARVLSRLQQLAAVRDGFEWTIELRWADEDRTRVEKVFKTGYPNLGYVTDWPEYAFEVVTGVDSPVIKFDHSELWGSGDAATHVKAAGDGEGDDKPYSEAVIDDFRENAGWPRLEERKTQQGVVEQDTLDAYAEGMAEKMFGGQKVIEIEAQIDAWPGPADVSLGDTVLIEIDTDQLGTRQQWRLIGYSLSPQQNTWKPVIAKIGEEDDDEGGI